MIWAPAWASRTVLSCTWSRFPWFAASSSPHTSKWVPDGMAAPLLLCLPGLGDAPEEHTQPHEENAYANRSRSE